MPTSQHLQERLLRLGSSTDVERVLGRISVSRPRSTRSIVDLRGAYGAPNIHAELADEHGLRVGCKRVARLMRAAGLRGVMGRGALKDHDDGASRHGTSQR